MIKIPALEGKRIDLDMTPQEVIRTTLVHNHEEYHRLQREIEADLLEEERAAKANLAFPFVDVWNFKSALAWMVFDEQGYLSRSERVSKEDQEKLGITDKMLLDAVYSVGGTINRIGLYPINEEIKNQLQKVL